MPRHVFSERYADRESLIRLCVRFQEEYKRRGLLHRVWPTTDDVFYGDYLSRLIKVLEFIPGDCGPEGAKALDVGCGEGRLLLLLKRLGFDATGADLYAFDGMNAEGVPRGPLLKACFDEEGVAVDTVDLERDRLPYDDNTFDLVTNIEVIEHLHNSPRNVMREMRRVLKIGGSLVLATPNFASRENRKKLLAGRTLHWDLEKYYNYEIVSPPSLEYIGHVREFTVGEVEDMLHWENFRITEIETYDTMRMDRYRPHEAVGAHGGTGKDAAPGGLSGGSKPDDVPNIPGRLAGLPRKAANRLKTEARNLLLSLLMAASDDGRLEPNMIVSARKTA